MSVIYVLVVAEGKCEIRGSVWKLPSDYEKNAIIEDNTSHIQSLELLCDLRVENLSGDTKWFEYY